MTDEPDSVDELISRYLDGEATDAEIARVESDPALAARAASMRAAIDAVAAPVEIPTLDLDRIRAAAIAESATTEQVTDLMAAGAARAEKLQRRGRLMAIAAAFVFLAVGAVAIQNLSLGGDDDDSADTATEATADSSDDAAGDDGSDTAEVDDSASADALSTQADDGDDMERAEEDGDADMADEAAAQDEAPAEEMGDDDMAEEDDMVEEEAGPIPFAATDLLPDELAPATTPEELIETIVTAYEGRFDAEGGFSEPDDLLLSDLCPVAIDLVLELLPAGAVSIEPAEAVLAGAEVVVLVAAGADGTLAVLTHPVGQCEAVVALDVVTIN